MEEFKEKVWEIGMGKVSNNQHRKEEEEERCGVIPTPLSQGNPSLGFQAKAQNLKKEESFTLGEQERAKISFIIPSYRLQWDIP